MSAATEEREWVASVRSAIDEVESGSVDLAVAAVEDAVDAMNHRDHPKDYVQRAKSALESDCETDTRAVRFLETALREGGEAA